MAFALLPFRPDDRSTRFCDLDRPVPAIVIIDIDRGARQRGAKSFDRRADRRFLVEARQKHGNAWKSFGWHYTLFVIPAKAGIQLSTDLLDSCLRGNDD